MRIVFGAYGMGHGHFSKAAVLVPLLEGRGHEVRVVSSGPEEPPEGYAFTWHRHFPGLAYEVVDGRADYRKSFERWVRDVPRVSRHLWELRGMVREFQPDVIVSDFEPLTASPFLEAGCEVISLCRQVALTDKSVPLPEGSGRGRKLGRAIFRFFTIGADRLYGYHYAPVSYRCVPPVIRPDVREQPTVRGEHVLVYNGFHTSDGGSAEELVAWAERRRREVIAYGFRGTPRGRQGRVRFQPASRTGLLADMASSRAVVCTAGISTPLEAFLLGKPVSVVPIPGNFEQAANAEHLQEYGLARWLTRWDYDAALEVAPPTGDHALSGWLNTPAERVLEHVLEEGGGGAVPVRAEAA